MWVAIAIGVFYQVHNWLRESSKDEEEREEKRREQEAQDARERRAQEAKEAAQKAAVAAKEQQRLDRFKPYSLSCEVDGEIVHVAWDGPLDDLIEKDPRPMTPALIDALFPALCKHQREHLQPFLRTAQGLRDPRTVYETDEKRKWKCKLQSAAPTDYGTFLRVTVRSGPPSSNYCPRCGRVDGSGGTNCADCPNKESGATPRFKHCG
jgi:hypothetical protein